eukprot:19394-Rhodomonas_salina.1
MEWPDSPEEGAMLTATWMPRWGEFAARGAGPREGGREGGRDLEESFSTLSLRPFAPLSHEVRV